MTCLARAVLIVDRYGEAIEYDLRTRAGLDLHDFMRGKYPWRKLLGFLDHLPSGSAYWAARAQDDELAEEYLAQDERDRAEGRQRPEPTPSLTEMTYANQLLMQMVDLQNLAVDRLERLLRLRPTQPKPLPRALTALERAKRAREQADIQDLIAEVAEAQARNN